MKRLPAEEILEYRGAQKSAVRSAREAKLAGWEGGAGGRLAGSGGETQLWFGRIAASAGPGVRGGDALLGAAERGRPHLVNSLRRVAGTHGRRLQDPET